MRHSYALPENAVDEDLRMRLARDMREYVARGFPRYHVYVSSNCEAFEPSLEERYRDTLHALNILRDAHFPVVIMTTNPV